MGKCLGCDHKINTIKVNGKCAQQITYDMEPFLSQCVEAYLKAAKKDIKSLKKVATPLLDEGILEKECPNAEGNKVGTLQHHPGGNILQCRYSFSHPSGFFF